MTLDDLTQRAIKLHTGRVPGAHQPHAEAPQALAEGGGVMRTVAGALTTHYKSFVVGSGLGLFIQQLRRAPNADQPSYYPSEIVALRELKNPNEETYADRSGKSRQRDCLPSEIVLRSLARQMIDEPGGPKHENLKEPKHQQQRNT